MPTRKTVYTLCVDNYAPEIQDLTFPLIGHWAEKIGAEFFVIKERKRPDWPVTIEKFQVGELAVQRGDEWSIFVDADALIHPEFFDVTAHLPKDVVAHNGKDVNSIRWSMDKYFLRDHRWVGSCTWFVVASEWTVEDLWRLPDRTLEETVAAIHPTVDEMSKGCCEASHLIDDYTLSRNIARFGLNFTTVIDLCAQLGWKDPNGRGVSPYLFHLYNLKHREKIEKMLEVLCKPPGQGGWGLMNPDGAIEYRRKWGLK